MALVFRRIFGRGVDGLGSLSVPQGQQIPYPNNYPYESASTVTIDTALQVSAVWACCKLLVESIGSLPIKVYDVDRKGNYTENKKHDIARLFTGKVNRWQNRGEFMETSGLSSVLRGNSYSYKQRNLGGDIIGLQPMVADQMDVVLLPDGSIVYQYQDNADVKVFAASSIMHVKGMGNGLIGLSPLDYMRNSVGIGQAAEGSVSKMYRNGGKPGGILTIDRALKADQRAAVKTNFAELAEGTEDNLLVLEADFKYQQVKMTPLDMELLSTRKFQIEDICRYFAVPKELIGSGDATTIASSFSEILYGFYKTGLRPLLQRYESAMESSLLLPEEQGKVKIEFDTDAFLRMSEGEMIKMLKEGITGAIFEPNEARERLGYAPKAGGSNLFMQQQMFPIEKLADPMRTFSTPSITTANNQTDESAAK